MIYYLDYDFVTASYNLYT